MMRALGRIVTALAALALAHAASAQEQLKVSVGGRGAFDNQISEVGQQQGLFKQHGLILDVRYSQGSGETLQTVIAGMADVGVSVGTLATLAAFAKGAPIQVVGSAMIGAAEFWYVPANSRIRSLKEAAGRKVAYSASGAASNARPPGTPRRQVPTGRDRRPGGHAGAGNERPGRHRLQPAAVRDRRA